MEPAVHRDQPDEQRGAVQLPLDVQWDALRDAADGNGGAGVSLLERPRIGRGAENSGPPLWRLKRCREASGAAAGAAVLRRSARMSRRGIPSRREHMKILFIGDIVGSPGRQIVREDLAEVRAEHQVDLVIANCENSASGFGITPKLVEELLGAGVEVLSGGNHIYDRKEILEYFPSEPRLLRPANFAPGSPGSGLYASRTRAGIPFALLNLQGRVFMTPNDCPFRTADRELERIAKVESVDGAGPVKIVIVDMHAEATSEKQAMGWYLDGRVTAVLGTH